MEHFVVIVNGWKPLTVITKRSILDVAASLDPSMNLSGKISYCLLIPDITFFSQQWRPKDFVNLATFYNQENLVPFSEKWLPENSREIVSFFLSDLVFFLEKNWSFQWLSRLLKELMRLTLYNWWELYIVNCNENCYHGLKQNILYYQGLFI